MNITISEKHEIQAYANIAKEHCLYENEEWGLNNALTKISRLVLKKHIERYSIAMLWDNDKPVGICLFSMVDFCSMHTYVKPAYRKQGYGIKLFLMLYKKLSAYRKTKIKVSTGSLESFLFFDKLIKMNILKEKSIIDENTFLQKVETIKTLAQHYQKNKDIFLPIWIRPIEISDIYI